MTEPITYLRNWTLIDNTPPIWNEVSEEWGALLNQIVRIKGTYTLTTQNSTKQTVGTLKGVSSNLKSNKATLCQILN